MRTGSNSIPNAGKGGRRSNKAPKGGRSSNKGGHYGGNSGRNPGPQGGPAKPHGSGEANGVILFMAVALVGLPFVVLATIVGYVIFAQ